jgi:hypothetical protein
MASVGICAPDWWNYKPWAKDIIVSCQQGKWVDIDFTSMLVQGASPLTERFIIGIDKYLRPREIDRAKLVRTTSQRGFLHSVLTTSEPIHGVFYRNMEWGKIRYLPHAGFIGIDCFRYVVTTEWQASDEFRVLINVVQAPYVRVYIHRAVSDPNVFSYSANLMRFNEDSGRVEPVTGTIYYNWFEQVPMLSYGNGHYEVVSQPILRHSAVVELVADPNGSISPTQLSIIDDGSRTPWYTQTWPNASVDKKGFIANTTELYRQPQGPNPMMVQCVLVDGIVVGGGAIGRSWIADWTAQEFLADSRQSGDRWWFRGSQMRWHPTPD